MLQLSLGLSYKKKKKKKGLLTVGLSTEPQVVSRSAVFWFCEFPFPSCFSESWNRTILYWLDTEIKKYDTDLCQMKTSTQPATFQYRSGASVTESPLKRTAFGKGRSFFFPLERPPYTLVSQSLL